MIQFMRGASSAVTSDNPTLQAGQPFYEIDTHKLKIGDGSTVWNSLPYIGDSRQYYDIVIGSASYNSGYTAEDVDYWCDGTDDSAVIQSAIDNLPYHRGSILFRAGSYSISTTINIPDPSFSELLLCSEGHCEITGISSITMFNIQDIHNVTFRGINFHHNSGSSHSIFSISSNSRVKFFNCGFEGNFSDSSYPVSVDASSVDFKNCLFDSQSAAANLYLEGRSTINVIDCKFEYKGIQTSSSFFDNYNNYRLTISGCEFDNVDIALVCYWDSVIVSNNRIYCTDTGIELSSITYSNTGIAGSIVSNNLIYGLTDGVTGIVNRRQNTLVVGNQVYNCVKGYQSNNSYSHNQVVVGNIFDPGEYEAAYQFIMFVGEKSILANNVVLGAIRDQDASATIINNVSTRA